MTEQIETRLVSELTPHELNDRIYGDTYDDALLEQIKKNGVSPLVITRDNRIISGHRRHAAAVALGIERVAVKVFDTMDGGCTW